MSFENDFEAKNGSGRIQLGSKPNNYFLKNLAQGSGFLRYMKFLNRIIYSFKVLTSVGQGQGIFRQYQIS